MAAMAAHTATADAMKPFIGVARAPANPVPSGDGLFAGILISLLLRTCARQETVVQVVLQTGGMMQTVIVTGASSGIGRATALRFAKDGAAVLAVGRKQQALDEVARAIAQEKGRCETLVADVVMPEAPAAIVEAVERIF